MSVSCCTSLLLLSLLPRSDKFDQKKSYTQWISEVPRRAEMPKHCQNSPHLFSLHFITQSYCFLTIQRLNSLGERLIIDCFYSCAQESFLKDRKFPWKWNFGFRELKTQAHRKRSNSDTLTLEIEINVTFPGHALENYLWTVDHFVAIRCRNTRKFWICLYTQLFQFLAVHYCWYYHCF